MRKYFKNIYLGFSTIWIGMMITLKHFLFYKNITIQYPEQRLQLPERERNRLYVNIDDCIGCDQCVRACPVNCIEIDTVKAVPGDKVGKTGETLGGKKKALFLPKFTIDFAKCCYCELCVFPCPTVCIYMTDVFEFSEFQRNDLVYDFTDMTKEQAEEKRKKAEEWALEMQKKKEAAAKKPPEKKVPLKPETNDKNKSDESPDSKSDDKPSKDS